jgi:hypothetical protein
MGEGESVSRSEKGEGKGEKGSAGERGRVGVGSERERVDYWLEL